MSPLTQAPRRKIPGHRGPHNYLRDPMPRVQTDDAAQKIEIVRLFLERLDGFKRQEEQSLPVLRRFLEGFAVELPKLKDEEQSWRKATAPDFNIFRALHLERRETKLHSRFLAELLDPNGIHDQGDRFLTEFLELTKQSGLRCPPESTGGMIWKITTEEAVNAYDRLDIVLRGTRRGCAGVHFVTVIENKIDADEGIEQLSRYDKWLQKQQANFRNLVFLTPDGREPETISMDKCLCLSYREHVTAWLRKLLKLLDEGQAAHLRFAIDQYLQVVNAL